MPGQCPECNLPLSVETYDNISLCACGNCAGYWVHPEALNAILADDPTAFRSLEERHVPRVEHHKVGPAALKCPDCLAVMDEFRYCYDSPVTLQECPDCGGLWVEDGQLAAMQQWQDAAHRPATGKELEQLQVAEFEDQHEAFMAKQRNMQTIFNCLRRFYYTW